MLHNVVKSWGGGGGEEKVRLVKRQKGHPILLFIICWGNAFECDSVHCPCLSRHHFHDLGIGQLAGGVGSGSGGDARDSWDTMAICAAVRCGSKRDSVFGWWALKLPPHCTHVT